MQIDIAKAWKDATYRESLSEEQLALLPQHPSGAVELSDGDLLAVQGGNAHGHHHGGGLPQINNIENGLVNLNLNSLLCYGNGNHY